VKLLEYWEEMVVGKTTLMQIIFGSIPAENRYINVDGKNDTKSI
jgi:ABC-type uncharacterized transport system ATPase subunit